MHLLSDCRQNNNLTKGSVLCEAGWPVNKKPGGKKSVRLRGRGNPRSVIGWVGAQTYRGCGRTKRECAV